MSRTCEACHHINDDVAQFCGRCGHKLASPTLSVGATLDRGRYRLEKLLGEGGMGSVWQAHDTKLGRAVALKCLAPELTAHPTARRRMEQEARILARVEHPNIVQVRNVFDESGMLVMELELVSGGDLESMLRPGGAAEADVLDRMAKVLAGLEALHNAGLVHRDIKPANVLLTESGQPKITDLGVAHDPTAREKTRLGASLGTPDYMSPEQIQGLPVDARSDLYAMGVMAFQLLTGSLPFVGNSEFDIQAAHVREPPDMNRLRAVASPAAVDWIARALEKDPGARWQTATEMRRAVERVRSGETLSAQPSRQASPGPGATPGPAPRQRAEIHQEADDELRSNDDNVVTSAGRADGKRGATVAILVVAAAGLLGFGWLMLGQGSTSSTTTVETEASTQGNPGHSTSSAATGRAAPTPDAPPPHWVPSFRAGDRWRYRAVRTPSDASDAWRTHDHFVERKVESVAPAGDGSVVRIVEVGGPADDEERRFSEYYGPDGVGAVSGGTPLVQGAWSSAVPSQGDVLTQLPQGAVERVGTSPHEFWIHQTVGKVAETYTDGKGDTYKLSLVGYEVGGRKGGTIDGEVLRCVWTNRLTKKQLEPFETASMRLRGMGHTYIEAKGAFGSLGGGWITFEGGGDTPFHRIGDRGHLVNAKAWVTPSRGEWVAAIWWTEAKTSLTLTHLTGNTARSFVLQFDSAVTDASKLWRDHNLLLLQRGEQCVVGVKAKGPGGKKWAIALVPDDEDGSVQPRLLAGDWR